MQNMQTRDLQSWSRNIINWECTNFYLNFNSNICSIPFSELGRPTLLLGRSKPEQRRKQARAPSQTQSDTSSLLCVESSRELHNGDVRYSAEGIITLLIYYICWGNTPLWNMDGRKNRNWWSHKRVASRYVVFMSTWLPSLVYYSWLHVAPDGVILQFTISISGENG